MNLRVEDGCGDGAGHRPARTCAGSERVWGRGEPDGGGGAGLCKPGSGQLSASSCLAPGADRRCVRGASERTGVAGPDVPGGVRKRTGRPWVPARERWSFGPNRLCW